MSLNDIVCCVACGIGSSSVPQSEIEQQTEKHGEYICTGCEAAYEAILNTPKGEEIKLNKGYGSPCETLISADVIYYFDGPIVADPKRSFLGFGGSWFLIIKDYPQERGINRKVFVTNNLWHSRSIPESYSRKLKAAGKINSTVVPIGRDKLDELRELLNSINYI